MKTKQLLKSAASAVVAVALLSGGASLVLPSRAQPPGGGPGGPGGNFDPAQFKQMMMDRFREQLEITNDDEWKIVQERLEKVTDARMAIGGFTVRGMGRPGGGPGGPGGFRGMGGEPRSEATAVQEALDRKLSADDLKTRLAALRDARKAAESKLEAAQESLKQVLSVRQEAIAVLNGLLK
jgi:hypothetical protein